MPSPTNALRLPSMLLAFALLPAAPGTASASPPAPSDPAPACPTACDLPRRGDLNQDGALTISDIALLGGLIHGAEAVDACPILADVNGDYTVDFADIAYLQRHIFHGGQAPVRDARVRGDANTSGRVDVGDLSALGQYLWGGSSGGATFCFETADYDGSGALGIADFIGISLLLLASSGESESR